MKSLSRRQFWMPSPQRNRTRPSVVQARQSRLAPIEPFRMIENRSKRRIGRKLDGPQITKDMSRIQRKREGGDQRGKDMQSKTDRAIALVGLMAAGKSTIGRRLASRLAMEFVDADVEIERAADHTINEIFERFGEGYFRAGERRVIARLLDRPQLVLATGGGAFMDPGTRAILTQKAVTIWLRVDIDILVERCNRRDNRPLLKGVDVRETLLSLIKVRYPVYEQADITVDGSRGPHDLVVDQILDRLQEFGIGTKEDGTSRQ